MNWEGGPYLDRDEDIQVIILDVLILIKTEFLRLVLPNNQRILRQPLKETLRVRALNVEVQRLYGDEQRRCRQRERGQEGAHGGGLLAVAMRGREEALWEV